MAELHRTTLVLDDDARRAARDLAARWECSTSEAIRRALVHQRDAVLGVDAGVRRHRKRVLGRLYQLFDRTDPDAEIRRIKDEDIGF